MCKCITMTLLSCWMEDNNFNGTLLKALNQDSNKLLLEMSEGWRNWRWSLTQTKFLSYSQVLLYGLGFKYFFLTLQINSNAIDAENFELKLQFNWELCLYKQYFAKKKKMTIIYVQKFLLFFVRWKLKILCLIQTAQLQKKKPRIRNLSSASHALSIILCCMHFLRWAGHIRSYDILLHLAFSYFTQVPNAVSICIITVMAYTHTQSGANENEAKTYVIFSNLFHSFLFHISFFLFIYVCSECRG